MYCELNGGRNRPIWFLMYLNSQQWLVMDASRITSKFRVNENILEGEERNEDTPWY